MFPLQKGGKFSAVSPSLFLEENGLDSFLYCYLGLLEVPQARTLGLARHLFPAQQEKKDYLDSSLWFLVDLEGEEQESF